MWGKSHEINRKLHGISTFHMGRANETYLMQNHKMFPPPSHPNTHYLQPPTRLGDVVQHSEHGAYLERGHDADHPGYHLHRQRHSRLGDPAAHGNVRLNPSKSRKKKKKHRAAGKSTDTPRKTNKQPLGQNNRRANHANISKANLNRKRVAMVEGRITK